MTAPALALLQPTIYSEEVYLRLENDAFEKAEYFQGQIIKMAGATPNRNRSLRRYRECKQSLTPAQRVIFLYLPFEQ